MRPTLTPHPDPIDLYTRDEEDAITLLHAYRCAKCPRMFALSEYGPDARSAAHDCCSPVLPCKKCKTMCPRLSPHQLCHECWKLWQVARERAQYDAAEKVAEADYDGGVFDPRTDEFFLNTDMMRDHYDGDEMPSYAWCAVRVDLSLDAESILEHALETAAEDSYESTDPAGLQVLLDAWCAEQGCHWYEMHPKKVVLLAPQPADEALFALRRGHRKEKRCYPLTGTRKWAQ